MDYMMMMMMMMMAPFLSPPCSLICDKLHENLMARFHTLFSLKSMSLWMLFKCSHISVVCLI